jgi:Leucine-rich repeat (LRR) protein
MVPQLVSLDVSHCSVKRIAAKAFDDLTQLQKLDLSHNKLPEIRQKTVETIRGRKCLTLYFAWRRTYAKVFTTKRDQSRLPA